MTLHRPTTVRRGLLVPVAVLAVLLAGCTSGGDGEARELDAGRVGFTADAPVLVPGGPGEKATRIAPGEQGDIADADFYVEADVVFMTDMAVHHAQALEMAQLAPDRAEDPRVRSLAERIAAAQQPEIEVMQGWLVAHGQPEAPVALTSGSSDHGTGHGEGHGGSAHAGHEGMPGMATAEELTALGTARGRDFDVLFLELMTRHHEGALLMAEQALDARHPMVTDLVNDVAVGQTVEINRMQELLGDLRQG